MKKIMVMALVALFVQVGAKAQEQAPPPPPQGQDAPPPPPRERQSPEQRAKMQTDHMATELKLSDKQKNDIYSVNLKAALQMQDLQKGDGGRDKMKSIQQAKEETYKSILTADQMKQYQDMKAKMREQRGNRRGPGSDGPPPPPMGDN